MRVLTLNPGSSSLKVALISDGRTIATETWPAADARADEEVVRRCLDRWGIPDAAAIRFVHGGSRTGPVLLDDDQVHRLDLLGPQAPLHQPLSVDVARLLRKLLPGVPVVADFDTAFHSQLPPPAAHYALPRAWTQQNRLHRYGFHGLSVEYSLRRVAEMLGREAEELRLVCAHLGSGVSVTAVRDGSSVDTSMGFTPLEGAVMATRSGTIDPGILLHLIRRGVSVDELSTALYRRSGLAGMSGTSGDLRDVLAACAEGDPDAELAIEVYLHRLRREIGAAAMSLDRMDAVVFTGGIAEHHPVVLRRLIDGLTVLGLRADPARLALDGDREISPDGARVPLVRITAREDLELARHTEELLAVRVAATGRT